MAAIVIVFIVMRAVEARLGADGRRVGRIAIKFIAIAGVAGWLGGNSDSFYRYEGLSRLVWGLEAADRRNYDEFYRYYGQPSTPNIRG